MLDSISLAAIAQEARNCFLEEDAPEYLQILGEGIIKLKELIYDKNASATLVNLYKELARAAHSIKGGAGMTEMLIVSKLAHKIEDIFEGLQQNRVNDVETALQLLTLGINDLEIFINNEKNGIFQDVENLELMDILDQFLTTFNPHEELIDIGFADDSFIKTALTQDLSACIERVREIINNPVLATEENITNNFNILLEECQLLGQALNCDWLININQVIKNLESHHSYSIKNFALLAMAEIEYHRQQYFQKNPSTKIEFSENFTQLLAIVKQEENLKIKKELEDKLQEKKLVINTINNYNKNLRIPINKIIKIGDLVGQLLIIYESLALYENQMKQGSNNLKKKTKLLLPLKEKIESIYDELTIIENQKSPLVNKKIEILSEFDILEFDEYTQIHSALQSLTELITQVQEIGEDFNLVNREFQETLIDMRKSLDILDEELREVRLLPFINLAGSFIKPLEKLNQTYHKSVELVIEGKQILMDQNIIESLRTPFNHIIRNAFDHGIETSEIRQKLGKILPAKIILSAKIEGNNVILTITDDGKGIDLKKIYQKAIDLHLFSINTDFKSLTNEQILATIFSPGFSTASQVTDLSGRGMGMDIVKAEIEKLRGTIQVNTKIGKGTEFKLKIPMALNIISLLLVKTSRQILSFPSENILRIIPLSDYDINHNQLIWENEKISVYNLAQILPYHQNIFIDIDTPYAGLLLNINDEKIIITIDAILDEKPLVTKSFDSVVNIPAYVGGYTILGNGTVVPILVPDYFKPLLINHQEKMKEKKVDNHKSTMDTLKRKLSVIIIDDSVTVRRSLNSLLTKVGYNVIQCGDGKEAWNTLQNTSVNFDLAICDLEMPGFDGYKVLQLIRVSTKWQNLPVIMLTSRDNDLHRQKAFDLGVNAYITKPFNRINLLEKVKELVIIH